MKVWSEKASGGLKWKGRIEQKKYLRGRKLSLKHIKRGSKYKKKNTVGIERKKSKNSNASVVVHQCCSLREGTLYRMPVSDNLFAFFPFIPTKFFSFSFFPCLSFLLFWYCWEGRWASRHHILFLDTDHWRNMYSLATSLQAQPLSIPQTFSLPSYPPIFPSGPFLNYLPLPSLAASGHNFTMANCVLVLTSLWTVIPVLFHSRCWAARAHIHSIPRPVTSSYALPPYQHPPIKPSITTNNLAALRTNRTEFRGEQGASRKVSLPAKHRRHLSEISWYLHPTTTVKEAYSTTSLLT